jgi:hypothetical protein
MLNMLSHSIGISLEKIPLRLWLSLILPPPGNSKPELFCLNLIKISLLGWIAGDMASPDSRLLQRNPGGNGKEPGHPQLLIDARKSQDTHNF